MAARKGESKPEYTEEQRADIVERVCNLYESQNVTIESCCEAVGISQAIFYLWTAKYGEIGERYKKAKSRAEDHWFENVLKPKAIRATELLLEQREVEESKTEELAHQGLKTGDSRTIITKSIIQPNATAAIFAMKGVFPGVFRERHEHSGEVATTLKMEALTIEEKLQMVEILKKANGE